MSDLDVGAGDQEIMFGYASDEIKDTIPLTHLMATGLEKKLNAVRNNGDRRWLWPDGKTEVVIEYAPGIGYVGFDSSPNLATKHTIKELWLPPSSFFGIMFRCRVMILKYMTCCSYARWQLVWRRN